MYLCLGNDVTPEATCRLVLILATSTTHITKMLMNNIKDQLYVYVSLHLGIFNLHILLVLFLFWHIKAFVSHFFVSPIFIVSL